MPLTSPVTTCFEKHYHTTRPLVISEGGGRSGKTYSILQLLIGIALQDKGALISVVAESLPFLRRGAMHDFNKIMNGIGLWHPDSWSRSDKRYTFIGGSVIEFFSADNAGKALGAERDYLFINEANNIDYEVAFQLMARTNKRTFIDYNPRAEFWAHSEIMSSKAFAGRFDFVHSTFADNEMLNPNIKATMLARAAKDDNYRRVYVEGLVGSLDGLIFPAFETVDDMPDVDCYGLDWGYTNDPTAVVAICVQGEALYMDELIYSTGIRNPDLDRLMRGVGMDKVAPIYADASDPKSIDDLYLMGWNIRAAIKGQGSVIYGIELMRQYRLLVTGRSVNLIRELRNYTWATDKHGNNINYPIDGYNHGIDAVRYALTMWQENKRKYHVLPRQRNTFEL